jgi:hypothetical protein
MGSKDPERGETIPLVIPVNYRITPAHHPLSVPFPLICPKSHYLSFSLSESLTDGSLLLVSFLIYCCFVMSLSQCLVSFVQYLVYYIYIGAGYINILTSTPITTHSQSTISSRLPLHADYR